jgi:hypothetical protein
LFIFLTALPGQGFQTDLETVAAGQGRRMTGGEGGGEGPRGKMNEHADKDRILGYHIFIHFQSNPMGHMEMMPGCSRHEEPHECEHRHGAFLERGIHVRAQIPRLLNHSGSSHGGNHGRWMSMTGLFSVFCV